VFLRTIPYADTPDEAGPPYHRIFEDRIRDVEFATYVNQIPQENYARRVIIISTCSSGGFINDLNNPKTVIMTPGTVFDSIISGVASDMYPGTWMGSMHIEVNGDENIIGEIRSHNIIQDDFNYHLINALRGIVPPRINIYPNELNQEYTVNNLYFYPNGETSNIYTVPVDAYYNNGVYLISSPRAVNTNKNQIVNIADTHINNGFISILEAFNYQMRYNLEAWVDYPYPQYDDNANNNNYPYNGNEEYIGNKNPITPGGPGSEGYLGGRTYL